MAPAIDFQSLVGDSQTPEATANIQSRIVAILEPALANPGSASAESIASDIDALYKSGYNTDDKAEEFIWTLWTLYIDIVKQLSISDDEQSLQLLASVVVKLSAQDSGKAQIWREDSAVWGDLPLLGPCMREAWNFAPTYDNSEKDKASLKPWVAINSFAARLLGSSVVNWDNLAIWELRSSLEENQVQDTTVAVAHEWIAHAGKVLLDKSRANTELSQVDKRALAAGKLFDGEPGLNPGRWAFWTQRLESLASSAEVSEEAKVKAREAADEMKKLGN